MPTDRSGTRDESTSANKKDKDTSRLSVLVLHLYIRVVRLPLLHFSSLGQLSKHGNVLSARRKVDPVMVRERDAKTTSVFYFWFNSWSAYISNNHQTIRRGRITARNHTKLLSSGVKTCV